MKKSKFKQGLCRKAICIAIASCFGIAPAFANPTGPSVVNGSVGFSQQGNTLSITNTPGAIINWQGFSIGAGETTRFLQQNAASAVLNRVVGGDPSSILGTLQSNGRVFLVNPNGIVFGAGSRVDAAGLVASTLNLSDQDFLGGKFNFSGGGAPLSNAGAIATPQGGSVYLIAPNIENSGVITAPGGEVLLAAGRSVQLVDAGSPHMSVEITAPDNQAVNLGRIVAEGGSVGIHAGLVQQRGAVSADSAVAEGGKIVFKAKREATLAAGSETRANGARGGYITVQAEQGPTSVYGALEAKGSTDKGGRATVLGDRVVLAGNARIDASGAQGGGTVLVGGDYQGKNPGVQRAQRTYVGPQAQIRADARQSGDGGKVIVWADDKTRFAGTISARGGEGGGNGGFVETSGKKDLEFAGSVDLRAPRGKAGTLLLDPANISIGVGPADINGDTTTGDDLTAPTDLDDGVSDFPGATSTITVGAIKAQLASGNLQLDATSNITWNAGAALDIDGIGNTGKTLTLRAGGDIAFAGTVLDSVPGTSDKLNLTLFADSDANNFGTIFLGAPTSVSTQGGNILLRGADLDITAGATLNAGAGMVSFNTSDLTARQMFFSQAAPGAGYDVSQTELAAITGASQINIGSSGRTAATTIDTMTMPVDAKLNIETGSGNVILVDGADAAIRYAAATGGTLHDHDISITAFGGGSIVAANATGPNNPGNVEIGTEDDIILNTAGSIGSNANRIQFGVNAPSEVRIGNIFAPGGSTYVDMLGSVTFGNVTTQGGLFEATSNGGTLTLAGDVTTNNGNVLLKSGSNLTLAAGKTIDAGTGSITIGGANFTANLNGTLSTTKAGAGAVSISGIAGDLAVGNISAPNGNVQIGSQLDITGNVSQNASTSITAQNIGVQAQGNITVATMSAVGNVDLQAQGNIVDGNAAATNITAATLSAASRGTITLDTALTGALSLGRFYTHAGTVPVGTGALVPGDLTINGQDVGPVAGTGNAFLQAGSIAAAINAISGVTGVDAYRDSGGKVVLVSKTGSAITIAGADLSNTGLTAGVAVPTTALGNYVVKNTGALSVGTVSNMGAAVILDSTGSISGNSDIVAAQLTASAAGGIALTGANNKVDTVSLTNATSGNVAYLSNMGGGTVSVSASNTANGGSVGIDEQDGNLSVNAGSIVTKGGLITLYSYLAGKTVTLSGGLDSTGGGANPSGAVITVKGDTLAPNSTINAGTSDVFLLPAVANRGIGIEGAGPFTLTDTMLDNVNATKIWIGNAGNKWGSMNVGGASGVTHTKNINLAANTINFTEGAGVTAVDTTGIVSLQANTVIGNGTGGAVDVKASKLAIDVTGVGALAGSTVTPIKTKINALVGSNTDAGAGDFAVQNDTSGLGSSVLDVESISQAGNGIVQVTTTGGMNVSTQPGAMSTNNGDIFLGANGNVVIAGNVNAGTGDVSIEPSGTLTMQSAGVGTLTGANIVLGDTMATTTSIGTSLAPVRVNPGTSLTAKAMTGSIYLETPGAFNTTKLASLDLQGAGQTAQLSTVNGVLTVDGFAGFLPSLANDTLVLKSGGAGNDLVLAAPAAQSITAGAVTLNAANAIVGDPDVTINTSGANGNITLISGGTIGFGGAVNVDPGTGSVLVTTPGNADLAAVNALSLGTSSLGGNLSVSATGNIGQSGALTVTGTSSFSTGVGSNISLGNAANDFSGAVSITGGNNVTVADANNLVMGNTTQAGTITLTSGGILSGGSLGGTQVIASAANGIALTGGSNLVTASLTNSTSGNIAYNSTLGNGALTLSVSGSNNATAGGFSVSESVGSLTVGAGGIATKDGQVTLTTQKVDGVLTVSGNVTTKNGTVTGAGVHYNADNMTLVGTTTARNAVLAPYTAGIAIDAGGAATADAAGKLGLSDSDIATIVPGYLHIGKSNSGALTVKGPLSFGGQLALESGSSIGQAAAAIITAPALYAKAPTVALEQANPVGVVTGEATGGNFSYHSSNLLTAANFTVPTGTVLHGITATGDVLLRSTSTNGVSQAAGAPITAASLSVQSVGPVTLTDSANNISGTLAVDTTAGGASAGLNFFNNNHLTVGLGNRQDTSQITGVMANDAPVRIELASGKKLTVSSPIDITNSITTAANGVKLVVDEIDLTAPTAVESRSVHITNATATRPIEIGAACSGGAGTCLLLTDISDTRIKSVDLGVGNPGGGTPASGNLTVSAPATRDGSGAGTPYASGLGLFSAGTVTQTAAITANRMAVKANAITLNQPNQVGSVALQSTGGNLTFQNSASFGIGTALIDPNGTPVTINGISSAGTATVSTSAGAITDGAGATVAATALTIDAPGGIGTSANPLNTQVGQVTVPASGDVYLDNSGALTVNSITSSGVVSVVTHSPLTVSGAVSGTDIFLTSTGSTASDALTLNGAVTGSGNITLTGGYGINQNANVTSSGPGVITATANNGNINMPAATTTTSTGGTITYSAPNGNVNYGSLAQFVGAAPTITVFTAPPPPPAPAPSPTPTPTPEPTPTPTPTPTPQPTPTPAPEPTPTPAPEPQPTPTPAPEPAPEPTATPTTEATVQKETTQVVNTTTAVLAAVVPSSPTITLAAYSAPVLAPMPAPDPTPSATTTSSASVGTPSGTGSSASSSSQPGASSEPSGDKPAEKKDDQKKADDKKSQDQPKTAEKKDDKGSKKKSLCN